MGTKSDEYAYDPDKLKLEAGRFVSIKLTNQTLASHTFTIDSIACDTGLVPPDGSTTISFRVPRGTTVFYCLPHEVIPMNGEIIAK